MFLYIIGNASIVNFRANIVLVYIVSKLYNTEELR